MTIECLCVSVSVRELISRTACPIFSKLFVMLRDVAQSSYSGVAICYALPVHVIFHIMSHMEACRYRCRLRRVTSLRRRAQVNVPTASFWLRRVLDNGGRQD